MQTIFEHIYNDAMLRLITRADLENHPIARAIISELLKVDCLKFPDLYNRVCAQFDAVIQEKQFRKHIDFINEKFRTINNLDVKHEITIAQIYDITVEIDGNFYTRICLCHNIRRLT